MAISFLIYTHFPRNTTWAIKIRAAVSGIVDTSRRTSHMACNIKWVKPVEWCVNMA
jgi:hypothetical protein